MRKVGLAINVSLDGYVARLNGALDWVFRTMTPAQEEWITAFLREVGHHPDRPYHLAGAGRFLADTDR